MLVKRWRERCEEAEDLGPAFVLLDRSFRERSRATLTLHVAEHIRYCKNAVNHLSPSGYLKRLE